MLMSVLADDLTRVLDQYLLDTHGERVSFSAESGLVELREVALRPETLANAVETTTVLVTLQDVALIPRAVRGNDSIHSEPQLTEKLIKRAQLQTADAFREVSWRLSPKKESRAASPMPTWLLSDRVRSKAIDNILLHLKNVFIHFKDPFSGKVAPEHQ
ncbi:unnamed protein product [Agarophyton chilense]